jgi:hypothetical protein
MNETTKSLIRHILTAVGTVLVLVGVNGAVPIVDFLQENLDSMWEAIVAIVGFVTTLIGFFTDKGKRFEVRAAEKS